VRTISITKILHEIRNGNYSYLFSKYNKVERTAHFTSGTFPYSLGKFRWGGKYTRRLTEKKDMYLHF
jgi:hypothetical protein